ncbi:glutathione-regulated potassium-efflux system protein KefB [Campylobacter pinnipediorum subsp. pinnipediorum]|uniref:cation:proton antiporter n=1 Tax=Campylobacter pinnipediorum TaxID=1965231 RepID=UPI000995DA1B|nr:cation:proton antiporter [Campylobacter pinnipediorum]AQW81133.1 glutathione-regulated potassium-efflux system protein KefB [Campylobacter pinnipediorum subsp. pinnipediorum]
MEYFLLAFLITIFLSVILNIIFKKFEIPTIIGYIVTGIVISEFFNLKSSENIVHIAEFGIVFLMFTIGLEFSLKHLMSMKKEVFLNGGLQVFASGLFLAVFIFYLLGLGEKNALVVGLALSLSSTAIVLKILNDSGNISEVYGRKSLGILLFQDIAVIPILIMVDVFSSKQSSLNDLIIQTFFGATILVVLIYLIGKYLINWLFSKVIHTNSQEIFIATILFLVVGSGTLAHKFGFSFSLGAFLAGMMMAETEYKHQIESDLIPFRDLLLGLFFISIGMQINISVVFENIFIIVAIVVGAMIIKAFVIFAILKSYLSIRVSFKAALSICQVGEFALAVFGLMATKNMLEMNVAQILIASSVISMFVTPFVLKNLNFLADFFEKEIVMEPEEIIKPQKLKDHIVVFGYGTLGQEVVLRLKERGLVYLALESDIGLVELGRSRGENVFLGNAFQKITFENACISTASAVVVTVSNEQKLELIIRAIKDYSPDIQTVIRVSKNEKQELFDDLDKNFHFIKEEKAMARILVHEAIQCKIDKSMGY